jgi:hypothetical protein
VSLDEIHPAGYPATRDGIRLGIATLQDEVTEALDEWRHERHIAGWHHTAEELMQVAAVALRAVRSIREVDQA